MDVHERTNEVSLCSQLLCIINTAVNKVTLRILYHRSRTEIRIIMSDYVFVRHRNSPIKRNPEQRPDAMVTLQRHKEPVTLRKLKSQQSNRSQKRMPDVATCRRQRELSYPKVSTFTKSSRNKIYQPGQMRRDMHLHF